MNIIKTIVLSSFAFGGCTANHDEKGLEKLDALVAEVDVSTPDDGCDLFVENKKGSIEVGPLGSEPIQVWGSIEGASSSSKCNTVDEYSILLTDDPDVEIQIETFGNQTTRLQLKSADGRSKTLLIPPNQRVTTSIRGHMSISAKLDSPKSENSLYASPTWSRYRIKILDKDKKPNFRPSPQKLANRAKS